MAKMFRDISEEKTPLLGSKAPKVRSLVNAEIKTLSETGGFFCCRHVLALMVCLGFANVFALRFNLSVALVAMTNTTDDTKSTVNNSDNVCPDPGGSSDNTTQKHTGEFNWDKSTQGIILGAFFYGYILMQIPGGWFASKFGAKKLIGFGLLATSILTLLTPLAARTSVYLLICLRVLEGITEGAVFPAVYALYGKWAPLWEKSKLTSFGEAGIGFGTVVALALSGILCDSDIMGGWPSVFYIFGCVSCVWCVVWLLIIHDTPSQHPRISDEEKEYIMSSLGDTSYKSPPWKKIFSSPAVWAIIASHFGSQWISYTLLTSLPSYMSDILKFDLKSNGVVSALPYIAVWITGPLFGYLADSIRRHQILSTINTRRLFNLLAAVFPSLFLVLAGYAGCDQVMVVAFLILSVGTHGLLYGGYASNFLDISPRFSGILYGISNTFATIPGFAAPALVGVLTNEHDTLSQWRIIFYIAAGIFVTGATIFVFLARGEEQSWSHDIDIEHSIGSHTNGQDSQTKAVQQN